MSWLIGKDKVEEEQSVSCAHHPRGRTCLHNEFKILTLW